ncbi:MAG: hypothetical protein V2A73_19495, partial [Pseudomonadota bacterium]
MTGDQLGQGESVTAVLPVLLLAVGGLVLPVPALVSTASNAPSVHSTIDLSLDASAGRAIGSARITLVNPTRSSLARAFFWLYPNRLAKRSPLLDDISFFRVYPRRFNPGSMRVRWVKVGNNGAAAVLPEEAWRVIDSDGAGENTLLEIVLPQSLAPDAEQTLEVGFEVAIPERYGGFGCIEGSCVLLGGFYPMLAGLNDSGWDFAAPPAWSTVSGTLELDREAVVVAFGVVRRGKRVSFAGQGHYVPIVVKPRANVIKLGHRGVRLEYVAAEGPPPADDAAHQILPYSRENYAAMVLAAAKRAITFLAKIGAPVTTGSVVVVVEAPLRLELASAHSGVAVVSDQLFRLFPAKKLRKYHERELVRAIYATILAARHGPSTLGSDEMRVDAAAEATASYLVDLYTLWRWHKSEFAQDLLRPVSFVPAVDQLLYAPQVAFSDAYFGTVGDAGLLRDEATRFNSQRPRGRLYYEKLRDLFEPALLAKAMKQVLVGDQPFVAAIEKSCQCQLEWFWRQWSGPLPVVNYRLGERQTLSGPRGRWHHRVVVYKDVWTSQANAPVEPVVVRLVDGHGCAYEQRWDGEGASTELSFDTDDSEVASVEIDPRRRLSESVPASMAVDPRLDNRDPASLKFIYRSFGALLNIGDLKASLLFDFELARAHDLRNQLRLQLFHSESVTALASLSYSRWLGKKVTANRLSHAMTFFVSGARLAADYGVASGEEPQPGAQLSFGFG